MSPGSRSRFPTVAAGRSPMAASRAGSPRSRRHARAAKSRSRSSRDAHVRKLNRSVPPQGRARRTCCRFRVRRIARRARAAPRTRRHRDRDRGGAAPGTRRRAPVSAPSCGCWRCTDCCICSASTITTPNDNGRMARARGAPAPEGRACRGPDRTVTTVSPLLLFLLAMAAVYVGIIETAFSALMRLSLRLMAERGGRADRLGFYLDDPIQLFLPARLLLGIIFSLSTMFIVLLTGSRRAAVDRPPAPVRRRIHPRLRARAAAAHRRAAIRSACSRSCCRRSMSSPGFSTR